MFEERPQAPLTLPFDVPANEFMNLEGKKISGSRNWAVWGLDFLSRYDPDPLRYYLTVNMPESKDTDWDWDDFLHRNNDELVATWGNLVNRVLSFAYKHWEGVVPDPGELRPGMKKSWPSLKPVSRKWASISTLFACALPWPRRSAWLPRSTNTWIKPLPGSRSRPIRPPRRRRSTPPYAASIRSRPAGTLPALYE